MITRQTLRRSLAVLTSGAVLVLGAPSVALADTPAGWADAPHVSGFQFLLVLFLIPAGLAVLIAVLAALPSIVSGNKGYQAGRPFVADPQWFGGTAKGESADEDADTGGASARW